MCLRTVVSVILLALGTLCATQVMAQEPIGLHIQAMTSAERDAMTASLGQSGDVEVIYACVPAGIVVFRDNGDSGSREALRNKVVSAIAGIIPGQRITGHDLTLQDAEEACETVRGQ